MVLAEDEEGLPFEEDGFVAHADFAQVLESVLDELLVGDELLDDAGPGLIEALVPDAGCEVLLDVHLFPVGYLCDFPLLVLDLPCPLFEGHLVDFVDEHEHVCVLVELLDVPQSHLEVLQNLLVLLPVLDLEHVNQHLHPPENRLLLHLKVLLHERVLPSAVPQVQSQRTHEFELMFLTLHSVPYLLGVLGWKVGKNDGVHGGLACPRVPHQQHLLHLQKL